MKQTVRIPKIGTLHPLEVYEYYDGPRLFSCTSDTGIVILVIWVDVDDDCDTWYYIPISSRRLERLRKQQLELREAVKSPEDGWLWEVKEYFDERPIEVRAVDSEYIPQSHLPDPQAFIYGEGPLILDYEVRKLTTSNVVLDVALSTSSDNVPLVDTVALASVLEKLQSLVRTVFRHTIKNHTLGTLQVAGSFRSSFGLRFIIKGDHGDTQLIERGLSEIFRLLREDNDRAGLHRGSRVSNALTAFLSALEKNEFSIRLWSPNLREELGGLSLTPGDVSSHLSTLQGRGKGEAAVSPPKLEGAMRITLPLGAPTIKGKLLVIDTIRNSFVLEPLGSGELISGMIRTSMQGRPLLLNAVVQAVVLRTDGGWELADVIME